MPTTLFWEEGRGAPFLGNQETTNSIGVCPNSGPLLCLHFGKLPYVIKCIQLRKRLARCGRDPRISEWTDGCGSVQTQYPKAHGLLVTAVRADSSVPVPATAQREHPRSPSPGRARATGAPWRRRRLCSGLRLKRPRRPQIHSGRCRRSIALPGQRPDQAVVKRHRCGHCASRGASVPAPTSWC